MADDIDDIADPNRLTTSTPKPGEEVEQPSKLKDKKKEVQKKCQEKQVDGEKKKEKQTKGKTENEKKEKDTKKHKKTKDTEGVEKAQQDEKKSKKERNIIKEKIKELGNKEVDDENDEDSDEEEETEMTTEEKEDMYHAVRNSDYMGLHDCLEKKNADINMTWYKENLLMAAIRSEQTEMAEFLIDIGIDYNFKTKYFHLRNTEKKGKRIDCHEKSCRDFAYDAGNDHIVEIIDVKNNNVFPFVPIKPRHIWTKRPPAPEIPKHMLPKSLQESDDEDDSDDESKEDETDSGHPSARSQDKGTEDTVFSEMLDKMNGQGKDDGYGSMSPCFSPYLGHFSPHVYIPPEKPLVFHKATKASMALQTHNDQCFKHRLQSKSAPSVRNVKAFGSYEREKQQWTIQRERSNIKDDTISVQSLPFFRSYPSSSSSRRSSTQTTVSSPVAEVTKILGQSMLLKKESDFNKRSTQNSQTVIPSLKINQWCHKNTDNVFNRLSKSAQQRKIRSSNHGVNREYILHHRW